LWWYIPPKRRLEGEAPYRFDILDGAHSCAIQHWRSIMRYEEFDLVYSFRAQQ
jgi:hypothetical protein